MVYELAMQGDLEVLEKLFDKKVAEDVASLVKKYSTSEFLERALSFLKPEYSPKMAEYMLDVILKSGILTSGDYTALNKAKDVCDLIVSNPELLRKIEKGNYNALNVLKRLTLKDYITTDVLKDVLNCVERGITGEELTHMYGMIEKIYTVSRLKGFDIQVANENISEYLRNIYISQTPQIEIWNNTIIQNYTNLGR